MARVVVVFLSVLLIAGSAQAAIILVPANYPTIKAGINAAINGDIVLVADGIYKGADNVNIDFGGKSIIVKSENGAANCIIDCENKDNTRGFYFHSWETTNSIVDGFTIMNGKGDKGGGVFCFSSSPTLTNNIITSNSASQYGGGIFSALSCPIIINNIVTKNVSGNYGGGIYCAEFNSIMDGNIIMGNVSNYGGGIYCSASLSTMTNNIITGNLALENGGGIVFNISSPKIINNTITGNSANYDGGGILCWNNSPLIVTNTILWNNSPQEIYPGEGSFITCSDIQGGWAGEGNIDADPLFVNPAGDDYRLRSGSPCIDAGTSNGAPAEDIEGNLRNDGFPDMGAYEFILLIISVEIDIKPGSWPNAINPNNKGIIPVAILTTPEFDATTVDPLSIKFGTNEATEIHRKGHIEDVDKDGDLDMILHFNTLDIGIKAGDTEACLTGKTVDGKNIRGCDAIVTVPKGNW